MVCWLLLWCWCCTQMCSKSINQTNKQRLVKHTWIWAFGIARRTVFSTSLWCRSHNLPSCFVFRLFQSLTHELFQNVSCTGLWNPGTWSLMAARWFLGIPANIWHSEGVKLADVPGYSLCLGSLVLFVEQELQPALGFLGGSSSVTRSVSLVAQSSRDSVWTESCAYSPIGTTPHSQKQLFSCPQVSFPHCPSGNSAWPTHDAPPLVCVVLAAVMDFSEIMDKLGCGLCLTHEIAPWLCCHMVVTAAEAGTSGPSASLWCSQLCSVAASLLTLSVQPKGWKQLEWKKAHKNSSLLPNREGKYLCEICLESWVSSLDEVLFMSQNQPLFLLVSKDWC